MKYLLSPILLLVIGMSGKARATVYIPTPLVDQVKDSYGVVRGIYQGQVFKKNSRGDIITEVSISLKETSGLKPGDIINKNNFKVTYPGGVWQGIRHKVTGSPKFNTSEEVVLLIHRGPNGFHLLNFGLGKYSLKREGGVVYLNSSIFPKNSKISGIKFEHFQEMVEGKFGQPLSEFRGEKFVYKPIKPSPKRTRSGSRAPASLGEQLEEEPNPSNNTAMFWLMIILSVLGSVSFKFLNKKG